MCRRYFNHAAVLIACVLGALVPAAAADRTPEFESDVMPILSKYSCNAADCHGGAAGRGGLRLSLFGGDPDADFRSLVLDWESRRVNLVHPQRSLLVTKPTAQVDHGGELRFDADSAAAETLLAWIRAGAPRAATRTLQRIDVEPAVIRADQLPLTGQLRVVAEWSDGTRDDVTSLAVYSTTDDSAVQVAADGAVTVERGGRHSIIVQLLGQSRLIPVLGRLAREETPSTATVTATALPPSDADRDGDHWIDALIEAEQDALGLRPLPIADDATFLRRLMLDLAGRVPTVDELDAFERDPDPGKRVAMIDRLLDSDDFDNYLTYRLAELLRFRAPGGDRAAIEAGRRWIARQVAEDAAWDDMIREMLLATGDSHVDGRTLIHRLVADARQQAEYVTEVFCGVRLRCANCHRHPLDQWTQEDYHGLAQVFGTIQRGRQVDLGGLGGVVNPRTGRVATTRIPGQRDVRDDEDARVALVEWIVDPDNPYFARAMANRVWSWLMGRGLIEPVDDLRVTNPASHPELLDRLADEFRAGGYRLRPLIRAICSSDAYQRSPAAAMRDPLDRYYVHAVPKPLGAAVLADALSDVTGVAGTDDEGSAVASFVELADTADARRTLAALGGCERPELCVSSTPQSLGVAARLQLINGPLINARLSDPNGWMRQLAARGLTAEREVSELFRRIECRTPGHAELEFWVRELESSADAEDRRQRIEDLAWSLISGERFMVNW